MKIILVTPLLDHGGGQRFMTSLANYWISKNYNVIIILLRSGDSFFKISENIKLVELNYSNKNIVYKILTGLRAMVRLRWIIFKEKPNFVLSTLSSTNIFTLVSTIFLKARIFVRDAMSPYRKRNKIEQFSRKLLYKRAEGIIVMTKAAKDYVASETGSNNVVVIPNPVESYPINKRIDKEKIVINVGRLTGVKGQTYFLEACAKLNRGDWKFMILGDGELKNGLEKKIEELGIQDKVIMPGAVKNVFEWLSKSMIFASTSISEAWGNAICEAMVVGLPVISFDADVGPREIIDHNINGYLVPVGNVDELSNKIRILMDDEKLRNEIGTKAILKMKQFNIEKLSKKIIDFCS
ncbi:glycosyltransferase family 4 protein [Aureibaculum sp. 2210JD6-5]|uniref:glycosyltransferase family 4 protein n=1 Tax=Aureibaculum sp. 2210JD6-5 TaxID=3103957 RepID=UPI002AAE17A0|nr:glycosyltransferase family 4 protein [Aureibaculum sp. 2210JD6-5]MDY7394106.1 glycosyltransferase family 4 protein [Aureibaculum sp. 2210JD6-5]